MAKLRWRDYAELASALAVVVSLVMLTIEVRENTVAIGRQTALDRANAMAAPFFESELPSILAKIQAVDGAHSPITTYMKTYKLSLSEANLWERHLTLLWDTLEAQYAADGPSEDLDNLVSILLVNRDNQIYLESVSGYRFSKGFRNYISERQAKLDDWTKSHLEKNE